jgi:RimJ/RimL family protein N-acetyltransferase
LPKRLIDPIQGPRLRLRPLEAADLPTTLGWRNQDHIRRWFVHSERLTWEQHRSWFFKYLERDDDYLFMVEETESLQKPVGQVGLYRIDWPGRRAEFGRLLIGEPDAQGCGLAREATSLLLAYAFTEWGLRTIELEVFADNRRALRLYHQCGFEPSSEGHGMVQMRVTAEQFSRSYSPSTAA